MALHDLSYFLMGITKQIWNNPKQKEARDLVCPNPWFVLIRSGRICLLFLLVKVNRKDRKQKNVRSFQREILVRYYAGRPNPRHYDLAYLVLLVG